VVRSRVARNSAPIISGVEASTGKRSSLSILALISAMATERCRPPKQPNAIETGFGIAVVFTAEGQRKIAATSPGAAGILVGYWAAHLVLTPVVRLAFVLLFAPRYDHGQFTAVAGLVSAAAVLAVIYAFLEHDCRTHWRRVVKWRDILKDRQRQARERVTMPEAGSA
jgi:hypothetical protein